MWLFHQMSGQMILPRHRYSPYSGEELRAIRKKNGVGRPPSVNLKRMKQEIMV
jgi:hypothetical protein